MEEKGKLVRKADIPVQAGKPTPTQIKKWHDQQVPYRNFAGLDEDLDRRAAQFVNDRKQNFRQRMSGPMKRWSMNWSAANGEALWQEHEDDVHIPETKKALDNKVARVEEQLTQFDPVFECDGVTGEVSRAKAKLIESFTYRQMELAEWQNYIQPCAKDGELCNIMILKVQYEHLVEDIVEKSVELKHGPDRPFYRTERHMRRAVARSGVRLHQVDPFWFIYDIEAPNIQEAAYVGDESQVFLHELEAQARQGVFPQEQIKKLREHGGSKRNSDNTARADWPDMLRRSRSIALHQDYSQNTAGEHGARRVRVTEMWAWWDFGDGIDGVVDPTGAKVRGTHRVVITEADGIILRFQLNPYDRKFVPYAVAQVNRNGHSMDAPAPFDTVVQANAYYDRIASNIMRWGDLAVSPLLVTSDMNSDLPDSILGVRPGTVLRNAGAWDFLKMPDIGQAVGYFHNYWRREIEESSGVLRVFESPQGTATETERKVQEQQRMVRNSIRANAELWRQVAKLSHWMLAQFSSGPEMFRVVGKSAKQLGQWATMTPDVLQEDVDFRFLAMTNLHTFGNRLQGIRGWMQAWGALLPNMPQIRMDTLAKLDFELSVGRMDTESVFPPEPAPWDVWTQEEENAMLLAGQPVNVNENDDDEDHMRKLEVLLRMKDLPDYVRKLVIDHLNLHIQQASKKQAEAAAQRRQQMQQQMMQGGMGQPGIDQPAAPGGLEARSSERKGVTPGPRQERTIARTGRQGSGRSQTEEMAR